MTDDSEDIPLLSLHLDDGLRRDLYSFKEIYDWLETDFQSLHEIRKNLPQLGLRSANEFNQYYVSLSELKGVANRLANQPAVSDVIGENFLNAVNKYFEGSGSDPNRFDRDRFSQVLSDLTLGRVSTADKRLSKSLGISQAITDSLNKIEEQSEKVVNRDAETESRLDALESKIENLSITIDSANRETKEVVKALGSLDEKLDSLELPQLEFFERAEKKFKEVENARVALQDKLGLDEAAKYWSGENGKQRKHVIRFRWFFGVLIMWLMSSALVLWYTLADYRDMVKEAENFYDLVPYLPTNILLVLLAVWGVRVFVRLILSENHLATRAEEKGVLIQTYLALVNEGAADSEDRSIILGSIFAHSQDGLVEDDGMPQTPLNVLTKTGP